MKRFLPLFVVILNGMTGHAQFAADSAVTNIARITDTVNIISRTVLYIDSSSDLTPAQVMQKRFTPLSDFKYRRSIPPEMITFSFYIKFVVANDPDSARSVYLYPGVLFDDMAIYRIITPSAVAMPPGGQNPELLRGSDDQYGFRKITLGPGEKAAFLVYLKPVKNETAYIATHLVNDKFIEIFKLINLNIRSQIRTFGYVMSGVLLMMILFMAVNYILSSRKEFIYNSLYSACMFLLIFLNSYYSRTFSPYYNFFLSYFDFLLLVAGTLFYISFTRSFLNTKIHYGQLEKILKYGEWFILLLLVVYTFLNFFTSRYVMQFLLENIMKFLILGIGVYFIVLALKQRNRLLNYLAAGNAALVIFSSISLGLIWMDVKSSGLFTSSLFYYYIGIALELMFFLFGLTYKNRQEIIERIKVEESMKLDVEKREHESQIAVIKAQQEERNRISADMHDDLGAGMTTIRLYSELAKNKLSEQSIPEIDKISSSANELLNKMNAIIWSMSSSNDSLGNMTAYIRSYALEYFESTGVNCRINIPDNLPNIEVIGEIRRNVFLVVKEALNNVLKHAKATEVNISLVRVPDGLTLYIQDNGVGIDLDNLRQFGNGLKNMRKRMEDVKIEFSIKNYNGTLVTLHRKINDISFF